jgi:hypothetical protein
MEEDWEFLDSLHIYSQMSLKEIIAEYVRHVKVPSQHSDEPEKLSVPAEEESASEPEEIDLDGDGEADTYTEPQRVIAPDAAAQYAQTFSMGDMVRLASDNPNIKMVPLFDKRCGPVVKWIKSGVTVLLTSTPGPLNASIGLSGKDYYVKLQHIKHIL